MLTVERNNLSLVVLPTLTPAAELPATNVLEVSRPSSQDSATPSGALTLNYARHVGPVIQNGLPGATWAPNNPGSLVVRVRYGDSGKLIPGTLAGRWDERVFAKLPHAWASKMLESLGDETALFRWGSGVLEFSHAGLGEVGSTEAVVVKMASWIVQLLQTPADSLTEQTLLDLVGDRYA